MRSALAVMPLLAVLVGGCSNPTQAPEQTPLADKVGRRCTVQFKRGDGLGAGGDIPVSPATGVINGAEVCVVGQLRGVSGDWIEVESADREYVIPRESILLVQFDK